MPSLLVIDDDPLTLNCFRLLYPRGKINVLTAESMASGLKLFTEHRPDVVILDVRMPGESGLEGLPKFREVDVQAPVILMTGHGTAETAIEAMRMGAYEYVLKPLDPVALRELVARAFETSRLMRVPARLPESADPDVEADVLVGNCPAMQQVYKDVGRVAAQDVTVLILGESGTGKELVARAIYQYSGRAKGPFLAINCAAIPETLLESELFGHEKGAFTGADRRRIGKFEQCNKGTLFLDEIADMTALTQTKILRVLQERQFERVGGNDPIQSDVRVIAATNRDLEAMVTSGQFRGDLYYRLRVFMIRLPPLRERGNDLRLLLEHFLRRYSQAFSKELHSVTPEAMDLLSRYSWPGNVRELQSVLKQAILQATGPILVPEFLPVTLRGSSGLPRLADPEFPDLAHYIKGRLAAGTTNLHAEVQMQTERQLIEQVLQYVANNVTQAARILGISRATLRSKLSAFGLSIERSSSLEE